jgi:hypothetical protein
MILAISPKPDISFSVVICQVFQELYFSIYNMDEDRLIFKKNGISQDFSIDIMNLLGKREGFHAP